MAVRFLRPHLSNSSEPFVHDRRRSLALVRHALESVVDEMALTVVRTAFSPTLRDVMDFSTAFCNPRGEMVAQGLTLPLHLGSIPDAMAGVLEHFPAEEVRPGDAFILNDPFEGGMHLPDVFIFQPIFVLGRLAAFAATVALAWTPHPPCSHSQSSGVSRWLVALPPGAQPARRCPARLAPARAPIRISTTLRCDPPGQQPPRRCPVGRRCAGTGG